MFDSRFAALLLATCATLSSAVAQTAVNLSGSVQAPDSSAISGAEVTLTNYSASKTTDMAGRFSFTGTLGAYPVQGRSQQPSLRGGRLHVRTSGVEKEISITLRSIGGSKVGGYSKASPGAGEHLFSLASLAGQGLVHGLYLAELSTGTSSTTFLYMHMNQDPSFPAYSRAGRPFAQSKQSRAAAAPDTLTITAAGFEMKPIALTSLTQGDLGRIVLSPLPKGRDISIAFDRAVPQLAWAALRLDAAIRSAGLTPVHKGAGAAADIAVAVNGQAPAGAEGFRLTVDGGVVSVQAKDPVGAMYGMLDVAEQVRMAKGLGGVSARAVDPRFPFRAIKFNLPWSSYREGEALSLHTGTVKDTVFWGAFLDMMAENRYNALTLWNLHPWPYLIRPKNFPKATPFTDMELDTWRTLWRTLFRMAKDRGIKPYLVNWNIYVSEAFRANYDPNANTDKHFVGTGTLTEQVRRYNRECVTQVIDEYPDLAGLGTSAGDRMENLGPQESQDWIADVYYGGMKAASRKVEFIHRAAFRGADADIITRKAMEAAAMDKPLWTELKFNWSHSLSTPRLIQIHGDGGPQGADKYFIPSPTKYKVNWMIRNEDIFVLRWGQADFIRKHIAQNGQEYVGGYFLGSETYIPAMDYIHQPGHAHVSWKYEFDRKWLMFMQWGRLLHDPRTADKVFMAEFDRRYGNGTGAALFNAFELASIAPLRFASFARSTWDYTLYAEGFKKSNFLTLDELITEVPFDPGYMGINEYVRAGQPATAAKVTPVQLAAELEENASRALSLIAGLGSSPPSMVCEKHDIETWANFGLYFAKKIRAGIEKAKGNPSGSRTLMKEAVTYWEEMIRINGLHNRASVPNMQSGTFSWQGMLGQVRQEAN